MAEFSWASYLGKYASLVNVKRARACVEEDDALALHARAAFLRANLRDLCGWRRFLRLLLQARFILHTRQSIRLWNSVELDYWVDLHRGAEHRATRSGNEEDLVRFWQGVRSRETAVARMGVVWTEYGCHGPLLRDFDVADGLAGASAFLYGRAVVLLRIQPHGDGSRVLVGKGVVRTHRRRLLLRKAAPPDSSDDYVRLEEMPLSAALRVASRFPLLRARPTPELASKIDVPGLRKWVDTTFFPRLM